MTLIQKGLIAVEGSEEHWRMSFIETGLTATKYVPQLLAAFDVLPDTVDNDQSTTDSRQMLQQSVYSRRM